MNNFDSVMSSLDNYINSTTDDNIAVNRNVLLHCLHLLNTSKEYVVSAKMEIENIERESSNLIVSFDNLKNEYRQLQKEHDDLNREHERLQIYNSRVLDELEDRNSILNNVQKEFDELCDTNRDLMYKLELLKKEIDGDIF